MWFWKNGLYVKTNEYVFIGKRETQFLRNKKRRNDQLTKICFPGHRSWIPGQPLDRSRQVPNSVFFLGKCCISWVWGQPCREATAGFCIVLSGGVMLTNRSKHCAYNQGFIRETNIFPSISPDCPSLGPGLFGQSRKLLMVLNTANTQLSFVRRNGNWKRKRRRGTKQQE